MDALSVVLAALQTHWFAVLGLRRKNDQVGKQLTENKLHPSKEMKTLRDNLVLCRRVRILRNPENWKKACLSQRLESTLEGLTPYVRCCSESPASAPLSEQGMNAFHKAFTCKVNTALGVRKLPSHNMHG